MDDFTREKDGGDLAATPDDQQMKERRDKEVKKMIMLLLLIGIFSGENPIALLKEKEEKET